MEILETGKKTRLKNVQKHYSETIKCRHVKRFRESDQSVRSYCRQNGLAESTLSGWLKKYDSLTDLKGAKFIPISSELTDSKVGSLSPEILSPAASPKELSTPLTVKLHSRSGVSVEISDIRSLALCRALIQEHLSCSS